MKRFRIFAPKAILSLGLALAAGLLLSSCGGVLDATIGGTIGGLSGGTTVTLLDNGGDPITISANGTFTFDQTVEAQDSYNVTVETQPLGETCTISNGTGTVTQNGGDITDITVTCDATTTSSNYVFGTVSGLASGQSVVLDETSTSTTSQTVSADGPFVFNTALAIGATYSITVATNPSGQTCTIANGSGTIASSGNTTVTVTCQ